MAKGKPAIVGAVRMGGKLYREGDEEAFAKVADKSTLERLSGKGVITTGAEPAEMDAGSKKESAEGTETK